MRAIISAVQAAQILNVPPQMVRERVKNGDWKIGRIKRNKNKNTYDIFLAKVLELKEGNLKC